MQNQNKTDKTRQENAPAQDPADKALQEAHQRLRESINNLPDSYVYQYTYNKEGRPQFLYVSQGVERVHPGVKAEDVLKDAAVLHGLIEPDQIPALMEAEAVSARDLTDFSMDLRFRLPNGELRWFQAHSRTRRNEHGQVFWDGAAVDITARKRAEEALRQNAEMLHRILQTAMDGFLMVDMAGRLLEVNDAYCRMSGYTAQELSGMGLSDLEDMLTGEEIIERIHKIIERGRDRFESRHRRKDGSVYDVEVSVQYLPVEGGRFVSFLRDITDRKQAEENLRQSHQRYQQLVDHAHDGIFSLDVQGRFLFVNKGICSILGYTREELLGLNIIDTYAETEQEQGRKRMVLLGRGEMIQFERLMKRKDGSFIIIEVSAWKTEDGSIQAIVRDITERRKAANRLRESESRLRTVTENAPDTILQVDRQGTIVFVNRPLPGLPVEKVVGTKVVEWVPPDYHAVVAQALDNAFSSGQRQEYESAGPGPHGETRHYNVRVMPVMTEGKTETAIYIATDITEKRQVEEQSKMLNRQMQSMLSSISDAFFALDENMVVTYFNAAAETALGRNRQEVIGRKLFDAFPEGRGSIFDEKYTRALRERIPLAFETHFGIEPYVNWYDVRVYPFERGISVYFKIITDRKQAEAALLENEERLRALSANLADGMVYQIDSGPAGVERRFTYLSPAVERFHSLTVEAAQQNPGLIYGQVIEEDRARVAAEEAQAFAEKVKFETEVRVRMPSGEVRWRRFISSPRFTAAGRWFWDGLEVDVTEQKRVEEEKDRLQAQLNQAQKMESVGRLAGGVAHDFNNMLGVILGYTELAMQRLEPAQPLFAELGEIRKAAERSAEFTRQLLAFARKQTVAPKLLDLNETVEGMLKMLRRLIGEDIDLAWLPGKNLKPLKMDPSQIDQILANLCVNARDAISGAGKITIETGTAVFDKDYCDYNPGFLPGEYLLLAVSDDGCGMDSVTLSRLFEPFFTTKETGKGTGLGLATVYGIVGQNNGFIKVFSEPGHGAVFRIYLPQAPKAEKMPKAVSGKQVLGGSETILLVEDEPALIEMTTKMLQYRGYTVLAAATPGEAIRLARENAGAIRLLMTDVIMPEMNGRELANSLLSLSPDFRCLFMSGYSADVIAHHGVLDEGVHFIQKPFTMDELAAKVREALDRKPAK